MSAYEALAGAYDALLEDGDHRRRADRLARRLQKSRIPVEAVLDLGCGTGTVACLLAERGYRVVAVDSSAEMLAEADRKAAALDGGPRPFFLCRSMAGLRLTAPVDAAVSTLDALNYVTRPKELQETFRRVSRYLRPGGLFLFDVNTPYKLRRMDGRTWLDEREDVFCVWRTDFSERTRTCVYWVDLFRRRRDGAWERSAEEHRERAWEWDELRQWLTDAGFGRIRRTGDLSSRPPAPDEDRWNIEAVRL